MNFSTVITLTASGEIGPFGSSAHRRRRNLGAARPRLHQPFRRHGGTRPLTIERGASLDVSNAKPAGDDALAIGRQGGGNETLTVESGATLTAAGATDAVAIGLGALATGVATVTGAGALFDLTSGSVAIGVSGT
jgi:hypothetical protein